jgi:hypothetical protein
MLVVAVVQHIMELAVLVELEVEVKVMVNHLQHLVQMALQIQAEVLEQVEIQVDQVL